MAAIYLIRHGQASFGKADYDQLSDKGCEQARILGKYWQPFSSSFKTYSGDLLRHIQTLDYFKAGAEQCETSMTTHSGFNEFDHVDILKNHSQQWADFSAMSTHFSKLPNANKQLQKEFSSALAKWISCQDQDTYKESWPEFKRRCIAALNDVIRQHLDDNKQVASVDNSQDILIFTSGGTISIILQHVLGLSDQQTLQINQQLRNTSVTKLLFSQDMLSVDYFNNYSHLSAIDEDWVTFR